MSIRQTTFNELQLWEECDPTAPDPCILEPGNPKDCTGVLACPFAINAKYRTAAEAEQLVMGEQSKGCYQCSIPNCFSGTTGYCEPISKRCLLVQSVTSEDGGIIVIGGGDSGGSAIVYDSGDGS